MERSKSHDLSNARMTSTPEPAANPQPTDRDRENARVRQQIADRQAQEYAEAQRLALAALGPGWKPWMKLLVLDSDYHRTGPTEPVATVFKVYQGDKRLSENAVYLRQLPDGSIRQARAYEPLLGDLLQEMHPTRTLELHGQWVPCPRYSICWSALEHYQPRSAEELAALRASRERNQAQRAREQWVRDNPLLAWAETIQRAEESEEERGRSV